LQFSYKSNSYYTSKGKIWAYYPINSHDPQNFYLRIKLFECKPCDFTIQVNFFTFAINFYVFKFKKL